MQLMQNCPANLVYNQQLNWCDYSYNVPGCMWRNPDGVSAQKLIETLLPIFYSHDIIITTKVIAII
jgi:hypothetical protein